MNRYFFIILSIIISSCNSTKKDNYTYFGGKIINPKCNLILLYKEAKLIDSIKLTSKNTFMSKLKNITPGLYFFKHGIEHQYVYLEPKDSLLIRLNTWGFDESLVFSGTSAEKNNILVETFLQNEKDKKSFANFYKLNSTEFKLKIDSIKEEKNTILNDFVNNNPEVSEEFVDILNVALKYPIHTKTENFIRDNSVKATPETLNNSFLTHSREETNINRDTLMFYIPYRNYVYAHLFSDIYLQKLKKNTDAFTIALLKNVHAKITSEKQRNRLLRHITIRHFYNKSTGNINKETFDTYISLSSNERDKKLITTLLEDITIINEKQKIPSFTLLRPDGSLTKIDKLIKNKKTVIYFKGRKRSSNGNDWLASRVKYLMNKNKDTQFLIVNVDKERDSYINKLDISYQYSLDEKSNAHNFLNSNFPRVLLINNKGVIENSFGALSSDKIEKQIASL